MKVSMIGLDLAKNVFAVHGIDESGRVLVKRSLRRGQLLSFFAKLPPCAVGMEASAGAHHWSRELTKLGHRVRLMPASYVKAYVKRGKTDAADAEAICEAMQRPTMRFVPVKSVEQQALMTLHRARDLLVRQRTQTINVMRALCAEFGVAAAKGRMPVADLVALICDEKDGRIPGPARVGLLPVAGQYELLNQNIAVLDRTIGLGQRQDEACRRLITIPGIGPITATALVASIGDVARFRTGRDLAAWIGLTPKAHSSGGKQKLGRISRQGDRYLRKMLVQGASALVKVAATSKLPIAAWIRGLLARRPRKVVMIAVANKLARIAWALLARGGSYGQPMRVMAQAA